MVNSWENIVILYIIIIIIFYVSISVIIPLNLEHQLEVGIIILIWLMGSTYLMSYFGANKTENRRTNNRYIGKNKRYWNSAYGDILNEQTVTPPIPSHWNI